MAISRSAHVVALAVAGVRAATTQAGYARRLESAQVTGINSHRIFFTLCMYLSVEMARGM
ncbi:MAG: hypothetical protein NVS2B16_33020 [Chloroflexota bacterium]